MKLIETGGSFPPSQPYFIAWLAMIGYHGDMFVIVLDTPNAEAMSSIPPLMIVGHIIA
jgi:hypothetical protein